MKNFIKSLHFVTVVFITLITLAGNEPAYARGGHSSYSRSSGYHSSSRSSTGHVNSHSTTVHGYTRHNGTYVNSYHRTKANSTKLDNYSTKGNTNPYTGKAGTVNP